MATIRLILDNGHPDRMGNNPIRLQFGANSKRAELSVNVFTQKNNWDEKSMTILSAEPKFKTKNKIIQQALESAELFLSELALKGRYVNDAKKLRDMFIDKDKSIMFLTKLQEYADNKTGKTREAYIGTLRKLKTYTKSDIYFEDITPTWLNNFDSWCIKEGNKVNTRGIHFRNMRAIFNAAIDDRLISADLYPFRKFKISKEETDKRTLTIDEFRRLMAYNGSLQENWARDCFMLSFYMIGINMKDLFDLEPIEDKQVKYRRYKTHKLFNVFIEPETLVLIERYAGSDSLLNFSNTIIHHDNFRKKVNKYLHDITIAINEKEKENKSDFRMRKFTTYSARHSWGTFAGELDIPEKIISMAMGHESEGNATTRIYTKFNHKKVIEANRKVIDYVNLK